MRALGAPQAPFDPDLAVVNLVVPSEASGSGVHVYLPLHVARILANLFPV